MSLFFSYIKSPSSKSTNTEMLMEMHVGSTHVTWVGYWLSNCTTEAIALMYFCFHFSLNSYGYQPSEYVGAGEVAYGTESIPFGPAGPSLEASSAAEGRATPPGSEHTADREYKFNTEDATSRHSPCEENPLSPRSPSQ